MGNHGLRSMMRRAWRRPGTRGVGVRPGRGLTLVEVLIGLVVTAMLTFAMAQGSLLWSRGIVRANFRQTARGLLQDLLARLYLDGVVPGDRTRPFPAPYSGFRWRVRAQRISRQKVAASSVIEATIEVSWQAAYGDDAIEVVTLLPRVHGP
jgi:Tfp pilus assembly protein PilV